MVARRGRTYRNVQGQEVDGLQPVGGSDVSRLISGLDGVLNSTTAAAREIHNAAREMRIVNERSLMMSTGASAEGTQSTAGLTRRDLTEAFSAAINEQTKTLLGSLPGQAPTAPPSGPQNPSTRVPSWARNQMGNPLQYPPGEVPPPLPPASPGGWLPSPAHSGQQPGIEGLNGPASEPNPGASESSWEVFQRQRDYLGGKGKFSVAGLRQDLGGRMQETLGNWTWGEQLVQDPMGNYRHASNVPGEYGEMASESDVASFTRRMAMMGAARGGAQALAGGATLREAGMNMLPAGAARALGVVGMGVYAANKVADFAENQRATNARWQSFQGGSNLDAFGERAGSQMFQMGQMGVLSEADAQRLYEGVARTGMDEENRGAAQSFAVDNYKRLGMSIDQSMQVINTAARTGQESLMGLADALSSVTESAKDAGINTEAARQNFIQNWQTFSTVFNGPGAVTTAAAFTNSQTGMGARYQDIGTSGAASMEMMRAVGAYQDNPMTLNEVIATTMKPGGQDDYAKMWTGYAREMTGQQLGQRGRDLIRRFVAENGDENGQLTDSQKQELSRRLMTEVPNLDVQSMIAVTQQVTGISGLDPNNALGYLIGIETGEFDPGKEAGEQMRGSRNFRIDTGYKGDNRLGGRNFSVGFGRLGSERWQNLQDRVEGQRSGWRWGDRDARAVSSAFLQDVENTGRAGGVSQRLATSTKNGTTIAEQVEVQTADGPRIVSLAEAMEHFRDQIDAGTAVVAKGDKAGVTVAEAVGIEGNRRLAKRIGNNKGSAGRDDLTDIGEAKKGGGSGGGNVTITPSAELRKYFDFRTSGDVDLASTWGPPGSFHPPATNRPTGNP